MDLLDGWRKRKCDTDRFNCEKMGGGRGANILALTSWDEWPK